MLNNQALFSNKNQFCYYFKPRNSYKNEDYPNLFDSHNLFPQLFYPGYKNILKKCCLLLNEMYCYIDTQTFFLGFWSDLKLSIF